MTPAAPIAVVGSGGMLGRAVLESLAHSTRPAIGLRHGDADITSGESLERGIPREAKAVINCSAFTDVDGAETREAEANAINGEGVGTLARLCRERGIPLVHFSTDYVFSGDATAPYPVDGKHAPVNAYGRSKALGERLLWESGCEFLLARTSWLYAPWGNNFVRTMARLSSQRDTLSVVNDQRGRPTSCQYLAERTLALLDRGARGNFHVTDGGDCTWFEFTREIVGELGSSCLVSPCSSAEFVRPATRPAYSVLDLGPTEAILGPSRPYRENLREVLKHLEPL